VDRGDHKEAEAHVGHCQRIDKKLDKIRVKFTALEEDPLPDVPYGVTREGSFAENWSSSSESEADGPIVGAEEEEEEDEEGAKKVGKGEGTEGNTTRLRKGAAVPFSAGGVAAAVLEEEKLHRVD